MKGEAANFEERKKGRGGATPLPDLFSPYEAAPSIEGVGQLGWSRPTPAPCGRLVDIQNEVVPTALRAALVAGASPAASGNSFPCQPAA